MKQKIAVLTIVGLMIAIGLNGLFFEIQNVKASPYPHIETNDPWEGYEREPIKFIAEVFDLGNPPYDWVWSFDPVSGNVDPFTREGSTSNTVHWFHHTFPYPCVCEVTIEVTNSLGYSVRWPMMHPYPDNYVVVNDGDNPFTVDAGADKYEDPDEYISFCGEGSGGEEPYENWHWDFGNGDGDDGRCVYYQYPCSPGNHFIATVSAEDADGRDASDTCNVYIGTKVSLSTVCTVEDPFLPSGADEVEFNVDIIADEDGNGCVTYDYQVDIRKLTGQLVETLGPFEDLQICAENTITHDPEWDNPPNGYYKARSIVEWSDDFGGPYESVSEWDFFQVGGMEPIPLP